MTGRCNDPGACASCGLPRSDNLPEHVAGSDGWLVCDRCWQNPALFFMGRALEVFGSKEAIMEHFWRLHHGVKPGQATLFSCIPEFARRII